MEITYRADFGTVGITRDILMEMGSPSQLLILSNEKENRIAFKNLKGKGKKSDSYAIFDVPKRAYTMPDDCAYVIEGLHFIVGMLSASGKKGMFFSIPVRVMRDNETSYLIVDIPKAEPIDMPQHTGVLSDKQTREELAELEDDDDDEDEDWE